MRSSGVRAFFACLVVGRVFLSLTLRAKFVTTYTQMHSSNKGGKKKGVVIKPPLFFSSFSLFFLLGPRASDVCLAHINFSIHFLSSSTDLFFSKQTKAFLYPIFSVRPPLYIYDTGERHTTSCPNTFIKKNDALLIMVRKKSREEREREEALGEKRNEREKRDGTTERFCITWFSDTRRRA